MSAQVIGYLGENGVRDVRIPIGHLLDKWQGLRPSLVMVPVGGSDDEAYPVQYMLDGTDLVWHVSDADTAVAGTTKAAVRMVDDDGRVGMDEPFQVIISPNLSAGGEPPVVIKPWVDKLATLVPRAESAAERAENAAQNWETGTATNALALGGKPPEHYLPAVQLLDNPDFALAQAGYGGMHGNVLHAADRWGINNFQSVTRSNGITTITKKNGSCYVWQWIPKDVYTRFIGKPLTLAIKLSDGTIHCANGIMPAQGAERNVFIRFYPVGTVVVECVAERNYGDVYVQFRWSDDTEQQFSFEWLRLLPGTYTAETLPPFVPRPYAVELAECQQYYKIVDATLTPVFDDGTVTRAYAVEYGKMRENLDASSVTILSGIERIGWNDTGATFTVQATYPNNNTVLLYATGTVASGSKCWAMIRIACSKDL